MGAIYRFHPADPRESFEVFARGLRNTYAISISSDGTVWGADNDGGTDQLEELNAIKYGHDYGFPEFGTGKAPPEAGVTEPFRLIPGGGSTAVLASSGGVYYAHTTRQQGPSNRVIDFTSYNGQMHKRVLHSYSEWITALLERDGLLYAVHFDGQIKAIDPERSSRPLREFSVITRDAEQDGVYAFEPNNLDFRVGEIAAIDFRVGPEQHAFFIEGLQEKGDQLELKREPAKWPRFEHLFEEPGEYRFVCLIHEDLGMRGTITVRE